MVRLTDASALLHSELQSAVALSSDGLGNARHYAINESILKRGVSKFNSSAVSLNKCTITPIKP